MGIARLEILWLGGPWRLGPWPSGGCYRWMFDIGPVRINWLNGVGGSDG